MGRAGRGGTNTSLNTRSLGTQDQDHERNFPMDIVWIDGRSDRSIQHFQARSSRPRKEN